MALSWKYKEYKRRFLYKEYKDYKSLEVHMQNPFIPTFGVSPVVLGGDDSLIRDFGAGLDGGPGDPRRTLLISGPRGIGKTVALNELEDEAARHGWVVLRAQPYDLISPLVASVIPKTLSSLRQKNPDRRRITGVNIAGIGGFSTETPSSEKPEPSLIGSLNALCDALPQGSGALLTLDEVQSVDPRELWQLTAAVQDLRRDGRDVAFAAAGLPDGVATLLQHPGTTFLRRAQHTVLAPMTPTETLTVLDETALQGAVHIPADVLHDAAALTRGYPFLIQLLGYHLFERAIRRDQLVSHDDLGAVTPDVLRTLGDLVHQPALLHLPTAELEYLEAMAEVQDGQQAVPSAAIAQRLGKSLQQVSMVRQKLIDRELIYSPRRGALNFVIPHMGSHLKQRATRDTGWD